MNWEAIGAIGEVAGAIGVIATLIYLAIQIRSNTKAMRAQSISDVTHNMKTEMGFILQGHDNAAMLMKMQKDEPMTDKELMLADAFLTAAFITRQNEYFQYQQGILDLEVLHSTKHPIVLLLSSPTSRSWWDNEGKLMVAESFAQYVDEVLVENEKRAWWFNEENPDVTT
jgi:hypothetical protein